MNPKIVAGTTGICSIITVALVIFVLIGQITVDLGMLTIGILQVISGLIQLYTARHTQSEVIQKETYGTCRFTLIIGSVMLAFVALKVMLIALKG
ncbi:hypothetical protein [Cellulosilyticum ruminicola]|uniref:hypothetical protein n=1 Tax=Cellulosilyticum ruminicola TaxID=425254 RepID=UPI0006D19F2E|nr:hypothetical protein [Cellulosilyticum ruminicola]